MSRCRNFLKFSSQPVYMLNLAGFWLLRNSYLQIIERPRTISRCVTAYCSVLQYIAVCHSVSQSVAVCYSVMQCVAVWPVNNRAPAHDLARPHPHPNSSDVLATPVRAHRPANVAVWVSATLCNTLQHTATLCNTLQYSASIVAMSQPRLCACIALQILRRSWLQHTASHCTTLLVAPH